MIQNLHTSRKRKLPFFRTELTLRAAVPLSAPNPRELFSSACKLLNGELPSLLDTPLQQFQEKPLVNIRGLPHQHPGGESREEALLRIDGKRRLADGESGEDEMFRPCVISLITRFLDFRGKDIRHELRFRVPPDLDWEKQSLGELLKLPEFEPELLTIGVERFVPRVFTFIGNRVPMLKESFFAIISKTQPFEFTISDFDFSGELSRPMLGRLQALAEITGESTLQHQLEQYISDPSTRK